MQDNLKGCRRASMVRLLLFKPTFEVGDSGWESWFADYYYKEMNA